MVTPAARIPLNLSLDDFNDDLEDVDSYKGPHFLYYPDDTESLFCNLVARGGEYRRTVMWGLQTILPQLATRIRPVHVESAARLMKLHGEPFNYDGWMYIATKLDGRIPIRIRAVPEGRVVPVRNVLMTTESLDKKVPWISTWVETQLMRAWAPITASTRSFHCVETVMEYLKRSSDSPADEIFYKVHDFGSRGSPDRATAKRHGAAHLVNSNGTDTVTCLRYVDKHYGPIYEIPGRSIPASEHSTITIEGRERELNAHMRILEKHGPEYPMIASVSDSYHIFDMVEYGWCDKLLDAVKASGKTVIVRPDSGDPVDVTLKCLAIFDRKVGMRVNGKGFKVLPNYYRMIWPDGNRDEQALRKILQAMEEKHYSASNIAFGVGAGLHQLFSRDTCEFGYKTTAALRSGRWVDIEKDPITSSLKKSFKGRLDLIRRDGEYQTVNIPEGQVSVPGSEMVTVFENGDITKRWTWEEVMAEPRRRLLEGT